MHSPSRHVCCGHLTRRHLVFIQDKRAISSTLWEKWQKNSCSRSWNSAAIRTSLRSEELGYVVAVENSMRKAIGFLEDETGGDRGEFNFQSDFAIARASGITAGSGAALPETKSCVHDRMRI
jgi:hypothetical protein